MALGKNSYVKFFYKYKLNTKQNFNAFEKKKKKKKKKKEKIEKTNKVKTGKSPPKLALGKN